MINETVWDKRNRLQVESMSSTMFLQESPANAKGTRDSSACMKAHC